jgi:hypothetical protein
MLFGRITNHPIRTHGRTESTGERIRSGRIPCLPLQLELTRHFNEAECKGNGEEVGGHDREDQLELRVLV